MEQRNQCPKAENLLRTLVRMLCLTSRWGSKVSTGRYDVDSHTLILKLALSDACHYSEIRDSSASVVFSQIKECIFTRSQGQVTSLSLVPSLSLLASNLPLRGVFFL